MAQRSLNNKFSCAKALRTFKTGSVDQQRIGNAQTLNTENDNLSFSNSLSFRKFLFWPRSTPGRIYFLFYIVLEKYKHRQEKLTRDILI